MYDLRPYVAGLACLLLSALTTPEDALTTRQLAVKVVCAEALRAPRTERRAILGVALERARQGGWWGDDLRSVLLAPGQFADPWSPWCADELPPRDDGLQWSPAMVELHARLMDEIRTDVRAMRSDELEPPLKGATHFHARRLGDIWPDLHEYDVPPSWWHRFFR